MSSPSSSLQKSQPQDSPKSPQHLLNHHKTDTAPSQESLSRDHLSQKSSFLLTYSHQPQPIKLVPFHIHSATTSNLQLHCPNVIKKSRKYNWELHENLHIKFEKNTQDKSFILFLKMLRNIKNLQSLTIDFGRRYSSLSKELFESLIMCISRNLPKLKELSFKSIFSRRTIGGLQEKDINILVKQLFKGFFSLEKFTISTSSGLSYENFSLLSNRMTVRCPKLKFLSTRLENCDALIDPCLATLVRDTSHSLRNLQTLKMSFQNSEKITYRGYFIFAKLLGMRLPHLNELSVEFHSCETFDHKALNVLTYEIFLNLTHLHTLELIFQNCLKIKKEGFESFAKNMAHNQNKLKKLTIDLSLYPQRSDENLEVLAEGISEHLSSLENFSLYFNRTVISNQGIEAIERHIIEKLLNLKQLNLGFAGNQYIRVHQVHSLAVKIAKNLLKLEKLYLGFPALNRPYGSPDQSGVEEILKKRNIPHFELGYSNKYSW